MTEHIIPILGVLALCQCGADIGKQYQAKVNTIMQILRQYWSFIGYNSIILAISVKCCFYIRNTSNKTTILRRNVFHWLNLTKQYWQNVNIQYWRNISCQYIASALIFCIYSRFAPYCFATRDYKKKKFKGLWRYSI